MTDIQTPTRPTAQSVASLRQYVPKRMAEPTDALEGPTKPSVKDQKKFMFSGLKLKKKEKAPKVAKATKVAKAPKKVKATKKSKVAKAPKAFKLPKLTKKPKSVKASKPPKVKVAKAPKATKIRKDVKASKIAAMLQTPQVKPVPQVQPKAQVKPKTKVSVDRRRKDRRKPKTKPIKRKKIDFSFQSLNKYLRFSYASLFLLVFVFGGWTFLAKIQGAVIATGQVAVEGKPKIVQHLDGGIVSNISVKEGDVVSKNQTVLMLDATILNANLEAAETNYYENEALINRLLAEQSGQNTIFWSNALTRQRSNSRVALAMSGQEQLFQARKSALSGEVNQLSQRIEQFRDEDTGLISEIDFTRSELSLVDQELNKMRDLLRQNLVSRNRVTQLERDQTRLRNAVSKLETRRDGLRNAVTEAQISIAQIQRTRDEQVLTDLRQAQTQADNLSQALKTVSTKTNLVRIQAPVSGVVHEMTVSTVGGVIAPGQEIMQIIPARDSLVIKGQVMPQDIDQVSVGQATNVVFSALKQSAAPELDGIVSFISADSLTDPITGFPYFEVDIDVADSQLPKLNGQSLIPGMPADIFIQTQERSVFDYLVGPLKNTFKKTMRDG